MVRIILIREPSNSIQVIEVTSEKYINNKITGGCDCSKHKYLEFVDHTNEMVMAFKLEYRTNNFN